MIRCCKSFVEGQAAQNCGRPPKSLRATISLVPTIRRLSEAYRAALFLAVTVRTRRRDALEGSVWEAGLGRLVAASAAQRAF